MLSEDTLKIRRLNDQFRAGDPKVPGEIVITAALNELIDCDARSTSNLIKTVRDYTSFTKDNDPNSEHDFGSFEFKGETCFWKIDVYDHALKWAAPDPSDPKLSKRVLTIMLASDY
ncbi:MAG: DUF3768 domain-containing protein [Pseudomonadota bacterium]